MRITGQRNKRAPIRGVGVKQIHSHFGYCRAAYYKVNKAYEQGLAEEQADPGITGSNFLPLSVQLTPFLSFFF